MREQIITYEFDVEMAKRPRPLPPPRLQVSFAQQFVATRFSSNYEDHYFRVTQPWWMAWRKPHANSASIENMMAGDGDGGLGTREGRVQPNPRRLSVQPALTWKPNLPHIAFVCAALNLALLSPALTYALTGNLVPLLTTSKWRKR